MSVTAGFRVDPSQTFDGVCFDDHDRLLALMNENDDGEFVRLVVRVDTLTRTELEGLHAMIGGYLQRTAS